MPNQNIKCHVNSCKYNSNGSECSLDSILVGNDSITTEAKSKKETECNSFEA